MEKKRNTMELDVEDSAFSLMKLQLTSAMKSTASKMLAKDAESAAITLKIDLKHRDNVVPYTGEEIEMLMMDYKITCQITENVKTDGSITELNQFFMELDDDGQISLKRIPTRQHQMDEYL